MFEASARSHSEFGNADGTFHSFRLELSWVSKILAKVTERSEESSKCSLLSSDGSAVEFSMPLELVAKAR